MTKDKANIMLAGENKDLKEKMQQTKKSGFLENIKIFVFSHLRVNLAVSYDY